MTKEKKTADGNYRLLHPMRVVLVASQSKAGRNNVMTAAWCMPVNDDPFRVALAIGSDSVTTGNIRRTKEFTINIPGKNLLKQAVICGSMHGKDVDKASKASLHYAKSRKIHAPIIDECIGHLECRLWKTVSAEGVDLFIADVKSAYAEKSLLNETWKDKAKVLLHLGGKSFAIPKKI